MPIPLKPTTSLDLWQVKKNFESIARNALSLQNPSEGGNLYVDAVPGTADLSEGQAVFYINGANYRLYFRIGGVIKYATLN
ncbi:MAG: hypothetical protein ABIF11_00310 [Nitrospirota bacterium]